MSSLKVSFDPTAEEPKQTKEKILVDEGFYQGKIGGAEAGFSHNVNKPNPQITIDLVIIGDESGQETKFDGWKKKAWITFSEKGSKAAGNTLKNLLGDSFESVFVDGEIDLEAAAKKINLIQEFVIFEISHGGEGKDKNDWVRGLTLKSEPAF